MPCLQFSTAHGQPRQNVTRPQAHRIIATVAEHGNRPTPGSPAFAAAEEFTSARARTSCGSLRFGAGQKDRKRYAMPITDQMLFPPALRTVGRIRTGLRPATHAETNQRAGHLYTNLSSGFRDADRCRWPAPRAANSSCRSRIRLYAGFLILIQDVPRPSV